MKALDRQLLRDLCSLKTQGVSIALVIACGIGGLIASFSTYDSLLYSREYKGRGVRQDPKLGPGSLDPSQLNVPKWLSEVRELLKTAINQLGLSAVCWAASTSTNP